MTRVSIEPRPVEMDDRADVASNVHARRLDRDLVILDLVNGDYWGLDPIGARIWEALVQGMSLREIVSMLRAELAVDEARLTADVLRIAQELVDRKLLVPRRPGGTSAP